MANKLRQIDVNPNPEGQIPGFLGRLDRREILVARRQTTEFNAKGAKFQIPSKSIPEGDSIIVGPNDINNSGDSLVTVSFPSPSGMVPHCLGQVQGESRSISGTPTLCDLVSPMVGGGRKPQPGLPLEPHSRQENLYGRQSMGLGSSLGTFTSSGTMVPRNSRKIFEFQGAPSSKNVTARVSPSHTRLSCEHIVRQYCNSVLHSKAGRDEIKSPKRPGAPDSSDSGEKLQINLGGAYKRLAKYFSRSSKQTFRSKGRMVPQQGSIQSVDSSLGATGSRSVCITTKCESQNFLFPTSFIQPVTPGCSSDTMAEGTSICLSPLQLNSKGIKKDRTRIGFGNFCGPPLAKTGMVLKDSSTVSTGTVISTSQDGPFESGKTFAPEPPDVCPSGLALERESLRLRGFSERVISTLVDCRKLTTRKIYCKIYRVFASWKKKKGIKETTLPIILDFLQDGVDLGLAPSTLRVQIAALSFFLNFKLAKEQAVIDFLKAVSRSKPIPSKLVPPWDLSLVLNCLTVSPFEPLDSISLKWLTLKTAFLVAITSARRVGDIQALSIKDPYMTIFPDRIVFKTDPTYLPKVSSLFHRSQDVIIPSFCDPPTNQKEAKFNKLDVRRILLSYLETTKSFRRSNHLFVAFAGSRKGLQVSKNTIARWIREIITLAYTNSGQSIPQSVNAHSTRSLATSWAERSGASLEQICKAATWSSHQTFVRHYRVDLLSSQDLSFGRKVLQNVIPP
ncbi:uncharacterized protein [Hyperolius riggenbachi]|uniref:uncharacterized protein n=1 Tax=Hyperolius riggenbachi TaxID=752182 RepID=UPI0035A364BA